jgi:hypothetical protein
MEAGSGKQLASLGSHSEPVVDLAFCRICKLLAAAILTGGGKHSRNLGPGLEELLTRLDGENLAFSPDGTALASIVFGSVRQGRRP